MNRNDDNSTGWPFVALAVAAMLLAAYCVATEPVSKRPTLPDAPVVVLQAPLPTITGVEVVTPLPLPTPCYRGLTGEWTVC